MLSITSRPILVSLCKSANFLSFVSRIPFCVGLLSPNDVKLTLCYIPTLAFQLVFPPPLLCLVTPVLVTCPFRTRSCTRSVAAGNPLHLIPQQSPSLPHDLHARTYERIHLAAPVRQS
jgi:hypothetical protein